MTPAAIPESIDLKKSEKLVIHWKDGAVSTYGLSQLRSMCPCAACKTVREDSAPKRGKKSLLTILPGNYAAPITVNHAELVGHYGLRIDWSDQHGSGIYSFEYLRSLDPAQARKPAT